MVTRQKTWIKELEKMQVSSNVQDRYGLAVPSGRILNSICKILLSYQRQSMAVTHERKLTKFARG